MALNIDDVSYLVLQHFTTEQAPIMVAIACAESSLNPNAEGDSPKSLRTAGYNSSANIAKYWNCPVSGQTTDDTAGASIGLFQIFLGANHKTVMNLSGIHFSTKDIGLSYDVPVNESNACQLVEWLKVPENNVRAAKAIFDNQGYGAWSVYKYPEGNPVYLRHLTDATNSVNRVLAKPPDSDTTPDKPNYVYIKQPGSLFAILGITLAVALTTMFLSEENRKDSTTRRTWVKL